MISSEEKKEILEDGKSKTRRDNFRFAQRVNFTNISFDNYLIYLNNIQEIFSPFKVSDHITVAEKNKL